MGCRQEKTEETEERGAGIDRWNALLLLFFSFYSCCFFEHHHPPNHQQEPNQPAHQHRTQAGRTSSIHFRLSRGVSTSIRHPPPPSVSICRSSFPPGPTSASTAVSMTPTHLQYSIPLPAPAPAQAGGRDAGIHGGRGVQVQEMGAGNALRGKKE